MNQSADDIEAEIADFLGETTMTGAEADWRANVPAGTVLAQGMVQGAPIQFLKGSSGVHARGVALPERFMAWDTRTGVSSMLPTAQMRQQLAKRRPDGSRVYTRVKPTDIEYPVPIKETCKICYARRKLEGAPEPHRNFFSEDQLMNHMLSFHANEWAAMERQREIDSRREDANRLERLMITMMTAMNPTAAAKLPKEVRDQIAEMQTKVAE